MPHELMCSVSIPARAWHDCDGAMQKSSDGALDARQDVVHWTSSRVRARGISPAGVRTDGGEGVTGGSNLLGVHHVQHSTLRPVRGTGLAVLVVVAMLQRQKVVQRVVRVLAAQSNQQPPQRVLRCFMNLSADVLLTMDHQGYC